MKRSSRLSAALHLLVHLAQYHDSRFTSDAMAKWWPTNPVVIRRTLGALREASIVRSVTGPGGGWSLARDADSISLAEIYDALGESVAQIGIDAESPECVVEAAVEVLLVDTWRDVERQLIARLRQTSLADLVAEAGMPSLIHGNESHHEH